MSLRRQMRRLAEAANVGASALALCPTAHKDRALRAISRQLGAHRPAILEANARDRGLAAHARLSTAFIDRLTLNEQRINQMRSAVEAVMRLPDPVGRVIKRWTRPNGLRISKIRVPIGVICVIYESRPNVTMDCAALGIKSGNAMILKGGREALHSNIALFHAIQAGLREAGLPAGAVQLVQRPEREAVSELIQLDGLIDLLMPRGSEEMIRGIARRSRIPVLKHAKGLCHVYVDAAADLDKAVKIAYNAKCQRPGVCNAMETLLVHRRIAPRFLPAIAERYREAGVELRGDPGTRRLIPWAQRATAQDWDTEYLDLILSIRVVRSLEEAMRHIARHGSGLSEAIVTEHRARARRFLTEVDSACVYVNASTRFTDGYQFGLGAEIGISTDRLHARGPMALEELTTYKYAIWGSGQIREQS